MKKIFFLLFITSTLFSQSITITPSGTGAAIEANSTTKGFLPPRMTSVQRSNLTPTDGLIIYCTDCVPAGHYAYSGSTWKPMFDYLTSTGSCATYTVGQQAQGGTVIWVDDSGQHGLVAAPEDYSRQDTQPNVGTYTLDYFPWGVGINGNNTTFSMAQRIGVYGGKENTDNIIKQFGWAEYGAFLCTLKNWGGYGDWYLPTIGELTILYSNRNLLPTPLTTNSNSNVNPVGDYYWSSTEANPIQAYSLKVSNDFALNGGIAIGSIGTTYKWLSSNFSSNPIGVFKCHIRAVRRF